MRKYYRIIEFLSPDAYTQLTFNPSGTIVWSNRLYQSMYSQDQNVLEGNVTTHVPSPMSGNHRFNGALVIAMRAEEITKEEADGEIDCLGNYEMD